MQLSEPSHSLTLLSLSVHSSSALTRGSSSSGSRGKFQGELLLTLAETSLLGPGCAGPCSSTQHQHVAQHTTALEGLQSCCFPCVFFFLFPLETFFLSI